MSVQLALDKATNDLFKPVGGGVTRVSEGRYTVQAVRCRLNTLLGEWLLNPTIGWLSYKDFERNPDLFDIEMRAREIILSTQGVLTINTLSVSLAKRVFTLNFTASTIYGEISLEVPWDANKIYE